MSDIRARLAKALQRELDEHGYEDDDEKRGQVAHHFADVLLSLPDIAIVELPELDEDTGLFANTELAVMAHASSVRMLGIYHDLTVVPAEARATAAALLAAANAAEAVTQ